jgi:3-hydroxyisobutyrate dehydrogenase-like beta-hydroxyacid dehydrogenase
MTAQIGVTAATGFLGLGQMGGPMAERLIDAGTRLKVFDPDDQATARLVAKGAQAVASPGDAAAGCGIVFACLPTPDVSRALLEGPKGRPRQHRRSTSRCRRSARRP